VRTVREKRRGDRREEGGKRREGRRGGKRKRKITNTGPSLPNRAQRENPIM
jgi:hypothetical protein